MIRPLPVAVIFGATACGKTALAARLFASSSFPVSSSVYSGAQDPYHIHDASALSFEQGIARVAGRVEIISADSVQVYRGMPVGSAQPPDELVKALPHHLVGICDPSEEFSVADFVRSADELCREIVARGHLPVVLGGTAFYVKHFMYGMPVTPQADPLVREQLQEKLRQIGAEAMHVELASFDPPSAAKIHINDAYRIIRAHEVYLASGRPLSSFELSYRYREGFRFCPIFLDRPRDELYRRIEARVDEMFEQGLEQELVRLIAQGCTAAHPAMKAIGYREFFELSPDAPAAAPRDAVCALIKRNTKRYAKRQQTFFQSFPDAHRINMSDPAAERHAADILRDFYFSYLTDTGFEDIL